MNIGPKGGKKKLRKLQGQHAWKEGRNRVLLKLLWEKKKKKKGLLVKKAGGCENRRRGCKVTAVNIAAKYSPSKGDPWAQKAGKKQNSKPPEREIQNAIFND